MSLELPAFEATLAHPLNFGHILEICGKAQQDAKRISINFSKNKPDTDNDIDFKILLNFEEKHISILQFSSKDTTSIKKELVLAEFVNEFRFYIMLAEAKLHIALNKYPFASLKYNHTSLAQREIRNIEISGKLEYIKQLDHHLYFPHTWPPIQITDEYLDFTNDQPMPFTSGHIMILSARLEGNNKGRFIIQFLHARDNKRQELHVSVRFDTKNIIRNSKFRLGDDKLLFGREEIDIPCEFPFKDFFKPFKLAIAFCETEFRLAKDGQFLFKYAHRSPNVLGFVMGPKIFGTNGLNVRVNGVHHLCLDDKQCEGFEKYSL